MKLAIMLVMAFVLLVPVNAFAVEGYFENDYGKQVSQTPTVCVFQPNDSRINENKWNVWYSDMETAIHTWRSVLQQSGSGDWNITVVDVPLEKLDLLNYSACDITVNFVEKPYIENGDYANALGWWTINSGQISIVFLDTEFCGKKYLEEYHILVDNYCFKDTIQRSKMMASVLQHEFGHAIGLGHFVGYDYVSMQDWYDYGVGYPSLMTPMPPNEELKTITQVDINEVRKIYGEKGFGKKTSYTPVFNERIIPEPVIGVSGKGTIHLTEGKSSTFNISGSVPDKLYKRGQYLEIVIQKPDGTTKYEATSVSKTLKKFNHNLAFNYNDPTGKYKISLKFNDKVFDKKEINVTKQSVTPKPTFSDKDHDGIVDSKDLCPTKPETFNGYADTDGCPDNKQVFKTTSPIFTENQKKILTQKIDSASVSILELKDGMNISWKYLKEAEQKYTNSKAKQHVEKAWQVYNKLYDKRYNTNEDLDKVVENYLRLENQEKSSNYNYHYQLSSKLSEINSEISIIGSDMKYISQELDYAEKAHNSQKTASEKQCFLFWCS